MSQYYTVQRGLIKRSGDTAKGGTEFTEDSWGFTQNVRKHCLVGRASSYGKLPLAEVACLFGLKNLLRTVKPVFGI